MLISIRLYSGKVFNCHTLPFLFKCNISDHRLNNNELLLLSLYLIIRNSCRPGILPDKGVNGGWLERQTSFNLSIQIRKYINILEVFYDLCPFHWGRTGLWNNLMELYTNRVQFVFSVSFCILNSWYYICRLFTVYMWLYMYMYCWCGLKSSN